jgi:hypothetical protein
MSRALFIGGSNPLIRTKIYYAEVAKLVNAAVLKAVAFSGL